MGKGTKIFLVLSYIVVVLTACKKEDIIEPQPIDLSPIVYIECDNTSNDAQKINDAIADSQVGAEIVFVGNCLISQTIRLIGDRTYRGQSLATIIKQADGANLEALLASDVYLDNTDYTGAPISLSQLTLDGNRAMNDAALTTGIILRSWLSTVEDLQITEMNGDGIMLTNKSQNGTELNTSQVNGKIIGNFITGCSRHGVFVEDTQNSVSDWSLTDNWIADSGKDGIHLDNAAGWIINNNHIYGVAENAIYAHRLFGTTISNNYIEDFGNTEQESDWSGINATIQGEAASTISSNRIFNFPLNDGNNNTSSKYQYLSLFANYGTALISMTGNTIRGAAYDNETGFHFSTAENAFLKVNLSGNSIEDVFLEMDVGDRVTVN